MKHDLALRGHAFALRPVELADAAFIVDLRHAAGAFLNAGARSADAQRQWLANYFLRDDDYYFVIARNGGDAEGLAGIYDVDRAAGTAEWGRFAVRAGSMAAVEGALLVYRYAFDVLDLRALRCHTLVGNAQVIAFHDSCGLTRSDSPVSVRANGIEQAAIEHVLARAHWAAVELCLSASR